jgi:streptogrisin C
MPRTLATAAAAILLSAGMAATVTPATAAPSDAGAAARGIAISSDMSAALQRDLGLTAEQAQARLAADDRAARTEQHLRSALGARFGGAWLTGSADRFVVAITNPADAGAVRASGAVPVLVTRTERQLNAIMSTLDKRAKRAPAGVTGWYVDATTNSVVIETTAGVERAVAFAAASGVPAGAVRVEQAAERPTTLFDVRGADAYFINGRSRCSIGFSVAGGFVTAGHCGGRGSSTAGFNRVSQGTVQGSSFPGNDYGVVAVNSNWVPRGVVNTYRGGTSAVRGSREASNGASVCRSGSTTGMRCGQIQAKNQTVRYPQGTVTGLTRTNVCAEPGDSGGSWFSGDQAQGVTSGGSGNCTFGGQTFFQPVNEILSVFGLRLVTS